MACNQGPCPTKLPDCTGSRAWSALCTCVDRYFEFPLTSCPISYDVPSCIPLQPFSVIQFSSFQFHFLRESSFSLLHFSVTAIFCAATRFRILHFQLQFSTFHSLVFATSSSCRCWTTSQQLGPPHRSSLLLFSFLVLKAVGFEQSVQSKDKIKSLQVCVCVDHLQRCKTSHVVSFSNMLQGDMACNQGPCPTKLPDCTGSGAWSALCTCSETVDFLVLLIQAVAAFFHHLNRDRGRWFQEGELPFGDASSYIFRSALQPFEVIQSVVMHLIVLQFCIISIFRAGGGQAVGFLNIVFKARTKLSRCKCVHWYRSPTWWYQPFEGNTLPGCIADSTWLRNLQILNSNSSK